MKMTLIDCALVFAVGNILFSGMFQKEEPLPDMQAICQSLDSAARKEMGTSCPPVVAPKTP